MADLYPNWAALAAAQIEGTDYRLPIRSGSKTSVSHIAIHGGAIEPGSSEVANSVAGFAAQAYYSLEGIKPSGNSDLHITSTNYDEPKGLALVKSSDFCFSYHGFVGTVGVPETYVGGLDITNRDKVLSSLQGAGFTASLGNDELNGTSLSNIANKTKQAAGVQIEISNNQRQLFFPGNDLTRANRETGARTDAFYAYMRAIAYVANGIEARSQTTNLKLNLPTENDSMSDLQAYLNTTWGKIEKAANPTVVTSLPQKGPYDIGDRVFLGSPYNSSFVLLSKDPNWGWVWRPVQAALSPWFQVPANAFSGTEGFWYISNPAAPLQFALDNKSNCFWRGGMRRLPPGIVPNDSQNVFATLPNGLRHHTSGMYTLAIDPATPQSDTGITGYKGGRWYIQNDGYNSFRFHNSSSAQDVYFGGIEYVVSNMHYYSP